jgi:hypothetical protein
MLLLTRQKLLPLPFLEAALILSGGLDSQRAGSSLTGVRTPRSGNTKSWLPFLKGKEGNYLSFVFAGRQKREPTINFSISHIVTHG